MTLLELLAEGSIAAAELIALLFVSPAAAQAHAVTDAQAMQHLDALRAAHRACATGRLPMRDCDEEPPAGHVRLSEDERIADAWLLAPVGGRALADGLAAGAVELELSADRETWWSTLVVQRAGQPALAIRGDE